MAEVKENIEKLHIRLNLYDTNIAVTINGKDEEKCRKAEKLINKTVNDYARLYKGRREEKEILDMAMLEIALRYESEAERNDTTPMTDILSKLTSEIEDALSDK